MTTFRAQVVIPMFSGLPTDVVTNTLHFEEPLGTMPIEQVGDTMSPIIETFLEALYASPHTMCDYMRPLNAFIKWYDLSDPPPRAPYEVQINPVITTAANDLPTECAVVLSFQGERVSGQSQARRRGRIYLGGLGLGWVSVSTSSAYPRLASGVAADLGAAALALRAQALTEGIPWVIWSTVNEGAVLVTDGWVDNAIDTQRRRGVLSNSRVTWAPA